MNDDGRKFLNFKWMVDDYDKSLGTFNALEMREKIRAKLGLGLARGVKY